MYYCFIVERKKLGLMRPTTFPPAAELKEPALTSGPDVTPGHTVTLSGQAASSKNETKIRKC